MPKDMNQTQQDEDNNNEDDPVQTLQIRPRRHRRRPPCSMGSNK